MRLIDADRRQNRIDFRGHDLESGILLKRRQAVPCGNRDLVLPEFRQNVVVEITVLACDQFLDPAVEFRKQFLRFIPVFLVDPVKLRIELACDSGNADHEEFIEIAAENRDEFETFKERISLVCGFIQHTGIEFQPADVAVEELYLVFLFFRSHILCSVNRKRLCVQRRSGSNSYQSPPWIP